MKPVISVSPGSSASELSGFGLRDLWDVVRRRLKTILVVAVIAFAGFATITFQLTPLYTATSLVVVDSRESQLLGLNQAGDIGIVPATSTVETEAEIAHSGNVLERVVDRLDLTKKEGYQPVPSLWDRFNELVGLVSEQAPLPLSPDDLAKKTQLGARTARTTAVDALARELSVSRRGLTNIIAISYTAPSPDEAADIANAVAAAYLEEEATAKTAQTQNALDKAQEQAQRLGDKLGDIQNSIDSYKLQAQAKTNRDAYDRAVSRMQNLEQQVDIDLPDSRIVAHASAPTAPSFPPTHLLLIGTAFASLGLGLAIVLVLDQCVDGFTNVAQTEARTGVPLVSVVPYHNIKAHPEAPLLGYTVARYPLSPYAESIRRARIGTEAVAGLPSKLTVAVTSTESGEGKTSTAIALAESFALSGRKTILIDADLRHPNVAKALGYKNQFGLLDFLMQNPRADVNSFIIRWRENENLDIAFGSSGSLIATDSLVASERFESLIAFARTAYDVIVIDTPPVGFVVDARIIARSADMMLYVIRWASTHQVDVLSGLRELSMVPNLKIAAMINRSKTRDRYGYSDGYRDHYRRIDAGR